jgi:hypothetical protein
MSRRSLVVAVVVLSGGVAGAGVAGAATASKVTATLSGKKEIGGKGEENAKGTFSATFKSGQVCYSLSYSGVQKPLAAHIHKGTSKQNGAIVVDLKPKFGKSKAQSKCVSAKAAVISAIRKNPAGYYVNIHNNEYPAGAERGQLKAAT